MIPCVFGDLGKKARDLIEKGFPLNHVKLDHKSKSKHNFDINVNGTHALDTGKLNAVLETVFKKPEYGLNLTEKWSTSNLWTSSLSIEDKIVKGLKTTCEVSFEPPTGKRSAKAIIDYKQKYVHLASDIYFPTKNPLLTASVVFGCNEKQGYLAGVMAAFDVANKVLNRWQCSFGIDRGNFILHTSLLNRSDLNASVYQNINENLQSAVSVNYSHATHASNFTLASSYKLKEDITLKTKVDSNSLVTLSYGFSLSKGVILTLAGQLDGKNLDAGNHRLGLSIEFEN